MRINTDLIPATAMVTVYAHAAKAVPEVYAANMLVHLSKYIKNKVELDVRNKVYKVNIGTPNFEALRVVLSWLKAYADAKAEDKVVFNDISLRDDLSLYCLLEVHSVIFKLNLVDELRPQRALRTRIYGFIKIRNNVVSIATIGKLIQTVPERDSAMLDIAMSKYVRSFKLLKDDIDTAIHQLESYPTYHKKLQKLLTDRLALVKGRIEVAQVQREAERAARLQAKDDADVMRVKARRAELEARRARAPGAWGTWVPSLTS